MSVASHIPKGYRLHVFLTRLPATHQGSYYMVFNGLSREDVAFRYALAEVLMNPHFPHGYNPSAATRQRAHQQLLPIFEKYADRFGPEKMDRMRNDVGEMCDVIAETLTGYPPANDNWYWLEIEHAVVQEVPETIVFHDVTTEFQSPTL